MRKHAATTPRFVDTNLREFTQAVSKKREPLFAEKLPIKTDSTSTKIVLISTKVKELAWEANRNELEFE